MYPGQYTPKQEREGELALAEINANLRDIFLNNVAETLRDSVLRALNSSSEPLTHKTITTTRAVANRAGFEFTDAVAKSIQLVHEDIYSDEKLRDRDDVLVENIFQLFPSEAEHESGLNETERAEIKAATIRLIQE